MQDGRLPGIDSSADDRIVVHVDMDCFYASCERLRDPTLEGEPIVVGMGYEAGDSHGAVATASYEAREHGVESAQPIGKALECLPRAEETPDEHDGPAGRYLPVDMEYYKSVASDVKSVLHDCADAVREVSIDEAYLDVTDRTSWEGRPNDPETTLAEGYGRYIKQRIDREVGVPASVGIAPNMATAKIASDHDKPDGLTVVPPGSIESFLSPLDVSELHGVGPVTAAELREMGVETIGDLTETDSDALEKRFGERGRELYDRARGIDDRAVEPTGRPKSLSRETAFAEPTVNDETKRETARSLARDVAQRARDRGAMYRTIGIKVVEPPFDVNTRATSLSGLVDDPNLVVEVATDLLSEFEGVRVRKLGVKVATLDFEPIDQATLGGFDSEDISIGGEFSNDENKDSCSISSDENEDPSSVSSGENEDSSSASSDPNRSDVDRHTGQTTLSEFFYDRRTAR